MKLYVVYMFENRFGPTWEYIAGIYTDKSLAEQDAKQHLVKCDHDRIFYYKDGDNNPEENWPLGFSIWIAEIEANKEIKSLR